MNRLPVLSLAAALLCGCASAPKSSPDVTALRATLERMEQDPQVGPLVPVAMVEADRAIDAAAAAAATGDAAETVHRLHLARNRVEIARAQAQRRRAESRMRELTRQQGPVMLLPKPVVPDAAEQAWRKQLTALMADRQAQGWKLSLGAASFGRGQAELAPAAGERLSALAAVLKQYPKRSLVVEGHTDSHGRDLDNLELSQRRADAVKAALVTAGVEAARISAIGRGENNPLGDNATEDGRRQNRRVEVLLPD
ncbi:MAG TPA: OmpA family protein [Solimonas sp.]|nr:OmpA family protein [Solimonas sp.]